MEPSTAKAFLIHADDNVVTMLTAGRKGDKCVVLGPRRTILVLDEDIPYGHKAAVGDIDQGAHIVKYAQTIGRATVAIRAGCSVHVHNIESLRGRGDIKAQS
jgi:altronate dehydratase small subunit